MPSIRAEMANGINAAAGPIKDLTGELIHISVEAMGGSASTLPLNDSWENYKKSVSKEKN